MPRRTDPVNRHWSGFATTNAFGALNAGTAAITLVNAAHDRETIMRTRGELLAFVDALGAPGRLCSVAVGFALVPEGTGTTVLWSPFTDSDAPWFYYESFHLGYEEMVTDVIDVPMVSGFRKTIDSKAMRRMRNQEVQMVVENTTIASACAVQVHAIGRFLTQE